jgi:hypothetical protein
LLAGGIGYGERLFVDLGIDKGAFYHVPGHKDVDPPPGRQVQEMNGLAALQIHTGEEVVPRRQLDIAERCNGQIPVLSGL